MILCLGSLLSDGCGWWLGTEVRSLGGLVAEVSDGRNSYDVRKEKGRKKLPL